jgi:dTDP-4-dehydrorhamnose reductase
MTFSSDLVFDGGKQNPYVPKLTLAGPLNVYGKSKAYAEQLVEAVLTLPHALIVRTSSFFGPMGPA